MALLLGQSAQPLPIDAYVVDVLFGVGLFGANFGVARADQVLDENVRRRAFGWISAVVGHLSLAFVAATFVYVGHRRAEDVELAAGFGQPVARRPLLAFLDVPHATPPGGPDLP